MQAITFDFWDTIVRDDTDEPKRAAAGLPTKAVARQRLFVDAVQRATPGLSDAQARAAYEATQAQFRHQWKVEHVTPPVADRLAVGLKFLKIPAPADWDTVVDGFEQMEVQISPDLVPGIRALLDRLAGQYKIGIISDAIVTPGKGLRQILHNYDLARYFTPEGMIFSDEAGAAKPAARVFELACAGLGVAPAALAHVGDREANDIAGPNAFGSRSVLYTGAIDRGSATSKADIICHDYETLPAQLEAL